MHPFPSFTYKEAKNIDRKRPNREYIKSPGASTVQALLWRFLPESFDYSLIQRPAKLQTF